ncbi:MAG: bifunctional tetrahydrofolate synthase/dihydrofolate synthase [Betaproteobacteria bacterium]|nr:bifunctional tetrahydrofolate synthase/dihydrofolate synthase [Betaproteobacteria bacterium]
MPAETVLPADLPGWLAYIERQHPQSIALGLERVARVRDALALPPFCPIFTIGGTNGKGSVCAMLETILLAAGYRVGTYMSPHLLRYNERVRVDGREVDDATLIEAFGRVETARGKGAERIPLTYFEFGTLAAWVVFADAKPDALVMEIGLGGRLDAVNAFDSDCAVLTSIDVDHAEYLGATRDRIGWEKAHIFRRGRPAVVGDPVPPRTVLDYAAEIGADLQVAGRDFGHSGDRQQWLYWGRDGRRAGLAYPALRGANQLLNAAATLAAIASLRDRLPVSAQAIRSGLAQVELPGRFQVLPGRPVVVLDVAHNPHAAAVLAENLGAMGVFARTHAVVGMLRDKDIAAVCAVLRNRVTHWYACTLDYARGAGAAEVARGIADSGAGGAVSQHDSPREAFVAARDAAGQSDRIAVFGSFHTVADVMAFLATLNR